MSLVRMRNSKTGVVYVYESESYWDKEKKQPRNKRKLIGKIDPATGEIVPTGKPGKPKKVTVENTSKPLVEDKGKACEEGCPDKEYGKLLAIIEERNKEISDLKSRIKSLELECYRKDQLVERIRLAIEDYQS